MSFIRPILIPVILAQVVKPYDPNTMPSSVTDTPENSFSTLTLGVIAAVTVLLLLSAVYLLRRQKRRR